MTSGSRLSGSKWFKQLDSCADYRKVIRTVLCGIVYHSCTQPQVYMSSSYMFPTFYICVYVDATLELLFIQRFLSVGWLTGRASDL